MAFSNAVKPPYAYLGARRRLRELFEEIARLVGSGNATLREIAARARLGAEHARAVEAYYRAMYSQRGCRSLGCSEELELLEELLEAVRRRLCASQEAGSTAG
ncbi:hypothetical protein [Pyrodictium abyssi]|uniref:hypothetical protein n=1 Tax=Pyrodictium abyssi TaxID=54256 RepID=UPI0030C754FE